MTRRPPIVTRTAPLFPDTTLFRSMLAAMEFAQAASDLHADKQGCPADDIMSIWTQAEVDGQPLTVETVISDCLLLLDGGAETTRTRSEEHTSELQSLMRISYAVFCLKKKNIRTQRTCYINHQ